jgi:hypothetical protein
MNATTPPLWTWTGFLSWAFGPRRLANIALLVDEVKQRSAFLHDVPEAEDVRRQQRRLLNEIRSQCESQMLHREADLAGSLVALASSEELPAWKRVRLEEGCAALEQLVGRRLAHMAVLLGLGTRPADRLAA